MSATMRPHCTIKAHAAFDEAKRTLQQVKDYFDGPRRYAVEIDHLYSAVVHALSLMVVK